MREHFGDIDEGRELVCKGQLPDPRSFAEEHGSRPEDSGIDAILPKPLEGSGNVVRGCCLLNHSRNAKGRRSISGRGEKALSGRFDEIRKQPYPGQRANRLLEEFQALPAQVDDDQR
jgi:hypothetical protein